MKFMEIPLFFPACPLLHMRRRNFQRDFQALVKRGSQLTASLRFLYNEDILKIHKGEISYDGENFQAQRKWNDRAY